MLAPRNTFVKAFALIAEVDSGCGEAVAVAVEADRLKLGATLGGLEGRTAAGLPAGFCDCFAVGAGSSSETSVACATFARDACCISTFANAVSPTRTGSIALGSMSAREGHQVNASAASWDAVLVPVSSATSER